MKIEIIYSDINFFAGTLPDELVRNGDSLNQNIASIFETPKRSRWFRPRVGSDVNRHLFEPVDEITASQIQYAMEKALVDNGERRLIIKNVLVQPDAVNQQYFVEIKYNAPGLENQMFTFQFNLSRGYN